MYDKRGTYTSYISNKPSPTLIDRERERERERMFWAAQRTFTTNVDAMAAAYCFNYRIHFFLEVILLPNSRRRNKRSNSSLEKKRQEGGKKNNATPHSQERKPIPQASTQEGGRCDKKRFTSVNS
jgi:hypothetical protein